MQEFLIVSAFIALLVAFMRAILWLREIDTRNTNARIAGMRIERITPTRAIVFDGRDHSEMRPFYEIDIPEVAPSVASVMPPMTSDGVRWNPVPEVPARRDLLTIVNHSAIKLGTECGLIRAANKCSADGLIDEARWAAAIKYGVDNYGVVTQPRDKTQVGAYGNLARLADAINKHETIKPPAPVDVAQNGNKTA